MFAVDFSVEADVLRVAGAFRLKLDHKRRLTAQIRIVRRVSLYVGYFRLLAVLSF